MDQDLHTDRLVVVPALDLDLELGLGIEALSRQEIESGRCGT